jgi:hypothetical protein
MAFLVNKTDEDLVAIVRYQGRIRNIQIPKGLTQIEDSAELLNPSDDLMLRNSTAPIHPVVAYDSLYRAVLELPNGAALGTYVHIDDGMILQVRSTNDSYHINTAGGSHLAIIHIPVHNEAYLTILTAQAIAMAALGVDGNGGTTVGAPGRGIVDTVYNPTTGILLITFTDGTTYSTSSIKGTDGTNGRGISSTSYSPTTGRLSINMSDGVIYTTDDLRGAPGAAGSDGRGIANAAYIASTGSVTLTFTNGETFSTGDLRGARGPAGPRECSLPS